MKFYQLSLPDLIYIRKEGGASLYYHLNFNVWDISAVNFDKDNLVPSSTYTLKGRNYVRLTCRKKT